jgi:hypothetical protein
MTAALIFISGGSASWAASVDWSNMGGRWVFDSAMPSGGTMIWDGVDYPLELSENAYLDVQVLDVNASTVSVSFSYNFSWSLGGSAPPNAGTVIGEGSYGVPTYNGESFEFTMPRFGDILEDVSTGDSSGVNIYRFTVVNENLIYFEDLWPEVRDIGKGRAMVDWRGYFRRSGSAPNPPSDGEPASPSPSVPAQPTHPGSTSVSGAEQVFIDANLDGEGVEVLPGNEQAQMDSSTADSNGWYVLNNINDADIFMEEADSDILPDCYAAAGKPAADVTIQVPSSVPSGRLALLPMTYRVRIDESELASFIGASLADTVLSNPSAYLTNIFQILVIQKEIKQGGWEEYFTCLVDGILTPEDAYEMGILNVTGGVALTLELSYYLMDGPESHANSKREAFLYDGYLIVPDGRRDGMLRDQIWLSVWKDAAGSYGYGYSYDYDYDYDKGGGGGCDSGLGIAALIAAAVFSVLKRKRP